MSPFRRCARCRHTRFSHTGASHLSCIKKVDKPRWVERGGYEVKVTTTGYSTYCACEDFARRKVAP